MEKLTSLFLFSLLLVLVTPILGVFFGAVSGWLVGLVFQSEVLNFLQRLGVDTAGLTMWQVGAALGFMGGFLKTSIHQKSN